MKSFGLPFLIILLSLSFRSTTHCQNPHSHPGDIHWSYNFAPPGLGTHSEAVSSPTTLYAVGGYQLPAPGLNFTGFRKYILATWDGTGWSVTGPGEVFASGFPGSLSSIAVDGIGTFVGGSFTDIDGVPLNNIASWNGNSWQPLRGGVDGSVNVIKATGIGIIYVGGSFGNADGVSVGNIALWNGSTWERLYDVGNLAYGTNGQVRDISLSAASIAYVVGDFGLAGAQPADRFASWNRSPAGWQSYAANFEPMGGGVVARAGNWGTSAYVAGTFTAINGQQFNRIARFDLGSETWDSLGGGSQTFIVQDLEVGPSGDVYANGGFTASDYQLGWWDGVHWEVIPTEYTGLSIVAQGPNIYNLNGLQVAGKQMNGIGLWDGTAWQPLGNGIADWQGMENEGVLALINHDGDLIAGGFFGTAGGERIRSLSKWNGNSWEFLDPAFEGRVVSMASHNGILYVAGTIITNGVTIGNIASWNGVAWDPMAGISGTVESIYHDGQHLYAFEYSSSSAVKMWDGAAWLTVGTPFFAPNEGFAFAKLGSFLYLGGATPSGPLYRWDGTNWDLIPGLAGGSLPGIYSMKTWNNDLYVGGRFTTANGVTVNNVARWDGANWYALGSGVNGDVRAIEFDNEGNLYVGGQFGNVSEGTSDSLFSVAKWDGTRWTRLGTGVFHGPLSGFPQMGLVRAMAGTMEGLFFGGQFTHAGDKYSADIALWTDFTLTSVDAPPDLPDEYALHQNYPNPFNPTTTIGFRLPALGLVTLKVFDILGRELATLVNEEKAAGLHEVEWDASDHASGVYLYQLRSGGFTTTKKLMLLR